MAAADDPSLADTSAPLANAAHPLQQILQSIRRRVRWLTWIYGLATVLAIALGTAISLGLLDWLVRWDDTGVRWLAFLTWTVVAGTIAWRALVRPLNEPLSDQVLSARIEAHQPVWRGRLVSATQFAAELVGSTSTSGTSDSARRMVARRQSGGPIAAGSRALREAHLQEVTAQLQQTPIEQFMSTRAVRRRTLWGAGAMGLTLLLMLAFPAQSAVALARLAAPWAEIHWPRRVELQLTRPDFAPVPLRIEPQVVPRGEALDLYVVNARGTLPNRVVLETRDNPSGVVTTEVLRQATLRDPDDRPRSVATLQLVAWNETLQFRVVGGDDHTMPWQSLRAVAPPVVEQLRVTVTPPAYTGRRAVTLPDNVGHVQGLVGTQVRLSARLTQPAKQAELQRPNLPALPVTLESGGQSLTVEFPITQPGTSSYWLRLRDEHGLESREPQRYELQGLADAPPDVAFELPAADRRVTPTAVVPIRALATDDLRLTSFSLRVQRAGTKAEGTKAEGAPTDGPASPIPESAPDKVTPAGAAPAGAGPANSATEFVLPLLVTSDSQGGAASAATAAAESAVEGTAATTTGGQGPASPLLAAGVPHSQTGELQWELSSLDLQPGDVLTLRAEATDAFDLGAPHVGKSVARTLTILDPNAKQEELARQTGELVEELQQVTERQSRLAQQADDLAAQLRTTGELRASDVDAIRKLELEQQQVANRLASERDGLSRRSTGLQREFEQNRIADAEADARLQELAQESRSIAGEQMQAAQQALTRLQKLTADLSRTPRQRPGTEGAPTAPTPSTPSSSAQPDEASNTPEGLPATPDDSADPNEAAPTESPSEQPESASESAEPPSPPTATPESSPEASPVAQELAAARESQQRALERLQALEERLSDWHDQRQAQRELNSLSNDVTQLRQQTSELSQETASRDWEQLAPEQQAELSRLGERQRRSAQAIERAAERLDQAAESLTERDPELAEQLQEAANELRERGTASRLTAAAEATESNRLGASEAEQLAAEQDIKEALSALRKAPENDLEQMVKKTESAEEQASELLQKTRELADQAEQAAASTPEETSDVEQMGAPKFTPEQQATRQQLRQQLQQLERQLQRLKLREARQAAQAAQQRLDEAGRLAERGDMAGAAEQLQEAAADIEQLQTELAEVEDELREDLAWEQTLQLGQLLPPLVKRQQNLVAEVDRLRTEQAARGTLSRAQLKWLRDVATNQAGVAKDLVDLSKKMSAADVLSTALEFAGTTAQSASERLTARQLDPITRELSQQVVAQLERVQAAIQEAQQPPPAAEPDANAEAPPNEADAEEAGAPPQPAASGPQQEALASRLTELKLLRDLQQRLLEQTRTLQTARAQAAAPATTASPEATAPDATTEPVTTEPGSDGVTLRPEAGAIEADLARLAREQQRLTRLSQKLARELVPADAPAAEKAKDTEEPADGANPPDAGEDAVKK